VGLQGRSRLVPKLWRSRVRGVTWAFRTHVCPIRPSFPHVPCPCTATASRMSQSLKAAILQSSVPEVGKSDQSRRLRGASYMIEADRDVAE
jgi:hypothetical protein